MKPATCTAHQSDQLALRALLDSMPHPAWITEQDGGTIWHNQPWYRYTGIRPAQLHTESWRQVCAPEALAALTARWEQARRNGQPYELEVPLRSADGEFRWFLARAQPVVLDNGQIVRWLGTCTDVDQLRRIRTEAAGYARIKDQFLSTLSHELRTPLTAILGWAQVLRRGGRDAADLQRGLQTIERNARLQAQLIEDLLDMSSLSGGRLQLQLSSVAIAPLLAAAMAQWQALASATSIQLELAAVEADLRVLGDSERMQQLLSKLLHNAIKFSAPATRVCLGARRAGSTICITVADQGIGIVESALPHIFEPFHQADPGMSRRHGGLGLGLAIARQLAELHHGRLTAESAGLGQGARFTLHLPAAPAPD
ncbi:PAS domain-containing sensor histidine kinase [Duganella qianjiadongensis]|uniref:histidine kinase n=1 Tax=Duganella qianjiadongensis TaxID=2692176 RepID=A0ABW9VGN0_9BURK|nr:PAS domain-containing sensor histidine kinase [Duganella qianjiadongensis]MYM37825.1 PAS domain-containing protein [Duganella qianjiadongensis]